MSNLQRTEEWYRARLGKVGASQIADLMARTKTGYGASRANLMAELICERLTQQPTIGYTNSAMQWGIDTEPLAKAAYSFMVDNDIKEVGFLQHPRIVSAGCSPDGLIGANGLVEIKCPNSATHIDTLLSGTVDGKYHLQMMFQMAVTGRQWCDFVSFDPRMPPEMQLWTKRVYRDDKLVADIEHEVLVFLQDLNEKLETLSARYLR